MSKYTTEVRYICEQAIGLTESQGGNSVNDIIAQARTKIFDFDYPIFDEQYKSIIETKILKHYYTREIGLETVGLWKLKLDTKMNEIMPYYNQLYKSAMIEFNPFFTDEYTTLHNRNVDGSTTSAGTRENTKENESITVGTTKNTAENTERNKYADTPQGSLSDLENDKYLTNARKITENNSNQSDNESLDNGKETGNESHIDNTSFNNTEDYLEAIQGRKGQNASKLLLDYRKTFLNIDMQVIDELEELFLHLW